jgi:plastocyanin
MSAHFVHLRARLRIRSVLVLLMLVALGTGAATAHAVPGRHHITRKKSHRAVRHARSVAVRSGAAAWHLPPLRATSLALSPASAVPAAAAATDAGAPATTTPETPVPVIPPRTAIGVTAREYRLTFNGDGIAPGTYDVQLQNRGEDDHDLVVERDDTHATVALGTAASLHNVSARVTLATGAYTLYCDLPGHRQLGMQGTLLVTAP